MVCLSVQYVPIFHQVCYVVSILGPCLPLLCTACYNLDWEPEAYNWLHKSMRPCWSYVGAQANQLPLHCLYHSNFVWGANLGATT